MNFRDLPKGTMTYFPPEVIPLDLLYSSEDDDTFGFLSFHDEHESNVKDSREKSAESQAGLSPFYIPPNEDIDYDNFFITHSSSAEELEPVFLAKDFSSVSTSTSQPSVNFDSIEIGRHHDFDRTSVNVDTLENKHQFNLHRPSVNSDSLEIEHHLNFDNPSPNLDPLEIDRPSVNSDPLGVDKQHNVDRPLGNLESFEIDHHHTVDRPSVNSDPLGVDKHHNVDRPLGNLESLEIDHHHTVDRPSVNPDSLEVDKHHNVDRPLGNLESLETDHHHTVDRPSVNSDPLGVDNHHNGDRPSVNSDSLELKHHHNFDKPSSENAPFHFLSDALGESHILTNNVFEADENDRDSESSYSTTSTLSTQLSLTTPASYSFPSQTTIPDSSTAESGEVFFITGHSDNSNDADDESFSTTSIHSQPLHISSTPATILETSSSFLLPQSIPHNHGPNIQHHDITSPSFTSAHHHDITGPSSPSAQHHDITGPSSTSAQHHIKNPSPTSNLPKTLTTTKIAHPDLSAGLPKSHKFPSKEIRRKHSGRVTDQSNFSKERASKEESSDGPIPGTPGIDYPLYHTVPVTSFDCSTREFGGYYADPETNCQAFHICLGRKSHGFLCPIGTMFNQKLLVCDWWYNVACAQDPQHQL
ncbi:uncharacterized protein LOC135210040 isoform X2 [Macrobrachium nipponense]